MTVEKPKPKQLLRPITTEANSAMNQSQFLAITCNSLEAREKSRVHGAIGFGFDSHWLKNWRESFKPITKRSNRNHVINFDSHLKTALRAFAIIPSWSRCTKKAKCTLNSLAWHELLSCKDKECAHVVVRTSNMKISHRRFSFYVEKMHQKACRTCSTIIFPYSASHIMIDLWRCRCVAVAVAVVIF